MSVARRLLTVLALTVAALATIAAGAATSTPTTVATDACADPVAESDVGVTPWTDLCALTVDAYVEQPESEDADPVTRLEVRLQVADVDRATASMFTIRWDAAGCIARILLGDDSGGNDAVSAVSADCPDSPTVYDDCVVRGPVLPTGQRPIVCFAGNPSVAIPPPVVEGDEYVWELVLEGELAGLLGTYEAGTELHFGTSTAGGRSTGQRSTPVGVVCADDPDPDSCTAVGGDWMPSTSAPVVVRD